MIFHRHQWKQVTMTEEIRIDDTGVIRFHKRLPLKRCEVCGRQELRKARV